MPTSVDTNVLSLSVNLAPQGVRTVTKARQNGNGKDPQAAFAGVLKDTSAAQADGEGAEVVQSGTEQNALLSILQNPGLALLSGQSFLTKAGKDNQSLSVQSGNEQATADVSGNTGLLMAALLSVPLQTQAVASNTLAAQSAQAITPLRETAGSVNDMAGVSLLQVQMPVQATTASVSTATSVLPALSSTPVIASSAQVDAAKVLPGHSGNGNSRQIVPETVLNSLAATVLPGQAQQQTNAADYMGASISAGQPAVPLLGNAVMQELNIRQISVTSKTDSSTSLKGKAAVLSTASANRDADGTVAVGRLSMTIAGSVGTDAQAGLDLAAFAEPSQAKLKAASGDEPVVDSFAAVVSQQAEKTNLTVSAGQAVAQHFPDPHNVLGQVMEQGSFAKPSYDAGNTEMVIKLKPESLGELTLKVAVDNGVVSASFHSDNPEVRGVLQSSLQQLRQELTERGLQVDNVGVYAGLTDFSSSGQQEAFRQQQQQSAALKHTNTSDDFIAAVESTPVLHNTAVDDGVDYRV